VFSSSTVKYNVYANGTAVGDKVTSNLLSFATAAGTYTHTTTKGTAYVYYVEAVNASGGTMSDGSTSITTPNVPGIPTSVSAQVYSVNASDITVRVTCTAPSDGGSTITGYLATSSAGIIKSGATVSAVSGTSTSTTITLTIPFSTEFTFTVAATNAVGYGSASSTSNKVLGLPGPTLGVPDSYGGSYALNVPVTLSQSADAWAYTDSYTGSYGATPLSSATFYTAADKSSIQSTSLAPSSNPLWTYHVVTIQRITVNSSVYYSAPSYAHATVSSLGYNLQKFTTDISLPPRTQNDGYTSAGIITNSSVSLIVAGGGGGGGGSAGTTVANQKAGGAGSVAYETIGTVQWVSTKLDTLDLYIGSGGYGGNNKATHDVWTNDPNSSRQGYGWTDGGAGGSPGTAATASGSGGGGGGGSAAVADGNVLLFGGGGGGGGGAVPGTAGSAGSSAIATNTETVVNTPGTDGYFSGDVPAAGGGYKSDTAGGGGGGGAGGGTGGATAQSGGKLGCYYYATAFKPSGFTYAKPTTSSASVAGGTRGLATDLAGTWGGKGADGYIYVSGSFMYIKGYNTY
jgi:hypothetical protein